jgi:tetratricopeptide (TPR) repeat protein
VYYDRGQLEEARRYYLEALNIDRLLGRNLGSALGNLANVLESNGDLEGAVRMHEQSLEAFRQQGNRRGEASTLGNLGNILLEQGQLAPGKARYEQMMAIDQQIGYRRGFGFGLWGMSEVLMAQDHLAEAHAKTEEAIALRKELGDTSNLAHSQLQLAEILLEQGNLPEAASVVLAAVAEFEKQNNGDAGCGANALLSRILLAQAKVQEAEAAAARATDMCRQGSDRTTQFEAQFALAAVRGRTGNFDEAFKMLDTVRSEASRYGYIWYVLQARLYLGELELASGRRSAGRVRLQQLQADARARGFGLIARKSSEALQSR